jgi:hypothetical protein
MSQRIVTLGCGRAVTLGAYVAAWRKCLAAPISDAFAEEIDRDGWDGKRDSFSIDDRGRLVRNPR